MRFKESYLPALRARRLHSFEDDAHFTGLILSLEDIDAFANTGKDQFILHSEEPFGFCPLRMKRIDLLLNGSPMHFSAATI